jgi:hypothetical protein
VAVEVREVLDLWREAERTLRVVPADSPVSNALSSEIEQLRLSYHSLTSPTAIETAETIARTRRVIAQTRRTLAEARARLDRP